MSPRASWLFGLLLAAPAWSQQSFDLKSDAVRQILRETVAAISVPVTIEHKPAASAERSATIEFVPEEKKPKVERPAPRLPDPEPESHGPLSALVDVLLGFDDDLPQQQLDRQLSCQWRAEMKPTTPGYAACPSVTGDPLGPR